MTIFVAQGYLCTKKVNDLCQFNNKYTQSHYYTVIRKDHQKFINVLLKNGFTIDIKLPFAYVEKTHINQYYLLPTSQSSHGCLKKDTMCVSPSFVNSLLAPYSFYLCSVYSNSTHMIRRCDMICNQMNVYFFTFVILRE